MNYEPLGSRMQFRTGCAPCVSGKSAFLLESMVSVLGFWACCWYTVAISCLQTHVYSPTTLETRSMRPRCGQNTLPRYLLSILSASSSLWGPPYLPSPPLPPLSHVSLFVFSKDPRNIHSDLSSQDQEHNLVCRTLTGSPGVVRVEEDRIAPSAFDLPPVLGRGTLPPPQLLGATLA